MFTDPIADYLTRIRNANRAGHRVVDIPGSNIKREITKILFDQGYILSYKFDETEDHQGNIKIALKYDKLTKEPVIKKLQRISTPGLRKYSGSDSLPRILNGLKGEDNKDIKLTLYSGHDSTIKPLAVQLGLDEMDAWPKYCANIIIDCPFDNPFDKSFPYL